MLKTKLFSLLPLVATFAVPALAADIMDLQVNFQNQAPGNYNKSDLNADFPDATKKTSALLGFPEDDTSANALTTIADFGGNRVFRVKYPQGVVGVNGGGAQFYKPLVARDEYYFEYRLKFLAGFDFGLPGSSGGKLPGLGGGSQPAGGYYAADGFSTRYMWHPADKYSPIAGSDYLNLYFYYARQPSRALPRGKQFGEAIPLVAVKAETYYKLRQRVKLNTPGMPNGIIQIWVDDKLIVSRTNAIYRENTGIFKIDDLFFSTFYGGNQSTDAPSRNTYIAFDDFKVWHPGTANAATATNPSGAGS